MGTRNSQRVNSFNIDERQIGMVLREEIPNMPYVIRFTSESFNYSDPIPQDANAGNQFYGRDLAEYLDSCLRQVGHAIKIVDEDWGWLVTNRGGGSASFDICLNNGLNGSDSNQSGNGSNGWTARIFAFQRKKMLGLIPTRRQVEPDLDFCKSIERFLFQKKSKIETSSLE